MNVRFCKTCGAPLIQKDAYTWECNYCRNTYSDSSVREESERLLRILLSEDKLEKVANLRKNLYDALNEEYTDSEKICRICEKIKELLPDDFAADFYYTANSGNAKKTAEYITLIGVEKNPEYIDGMVDFLLRSFCSEYHLPLADLIERAYRGADLQKLNELNTRLQNEAEKESRGVYETSLARDVFVAYSSKDMNYVFSLVSALEESGLTCFVAARNLRHGEGAVQNYNAAIREAISNCRSVVFVSSPNSRSFSCDALKIELAYIKQTDINYAPYEYKQNYSAMPQKYKKPRVEFRISESPSPNAADIAIKEFFEGCEYAYTENEAATRIINLLSCTAVTEVPKEAPIPAPLKKVKFCSKCGSENSESVKFCGECGGREFVVSFAEYELTKRLRELESKIKSAEKKEEASRAPSQHHKDTVSDSSASALQSNDIFEFDPRDDGTYSVRIKDEYKDRKEVASNSGDKISFTVTYTHAGPEEVVIPSTYNGKAVTAIGANGFSNCRSIKRVTIPEGIVSIEYGAFSFCESIDDISLPEGLNTIAEDAFISCDNLKSIYIPESVEAIGENAFLLCDALESITFGGSEEDWELFGICDNELPDGVSFTFKKMTSRAMYNLGYSYENGKGGKEKNPRLAFEWYKKSADAGYLPGIYALGWCFKTGLGTDKDYGKAFRLYKEAAEKGYAYAQRALGVCYYNGQGVEKDFKQAAIWYEKAANQNLQSAQYNLASCYEHGLGVEKNIDRAIELYKKAAASGYEQAKEKLSSLEAELKSTQHTIGSQTVNAAAKKQTAKEVSGSDSGSLFRFELLSDGTYAIMRKGGIQYPEKTELPSSHNGIAVTRIGIFEKLTLESVSEHAAFFGCSSLKEIIIPGSITVIGPASFMGAVSDRKVFVPNSIIRIEESAFAGNTRLKIIFDGTKEEWDRIEKGLSCIPVGAEITFLKDSTKSSAQPYSQDLKEQYSKGAEIMRRAAEEKKAEEENRRKKEQQMEKFRSEGICQHCGGKFVGLFSKKCSVCGKPKDY